MFSAVSSWLSCRSRNSSRVSTFASGNSRTARSRAAVLASVTPPRMLMKVNSLSRFAKGRAAGRLVENACHAERQHLPRRRLEPEAGADRELVLVRVLVFDECAV